MKDGETSARKSDTNLEKAEPIEELMAADRACLLHPSGVTVTSSAGPTHRPRRGSG